MNSTDTAKSPRRTWSQRLRQVVLGFCILSVVLASIAWFALYSMDHGVANSFAGILTGLALMWGWIWIGTMPRMPMLMRGVFFVAPCLLGYIALSYFEFRGFSGEMMPQFRRRGVTAAARQMTKDDARSITVQGDTAVSSPQFWGPSRNGHHDDAGLASDWEQNPPKVLWKVPIGDGWAGMAVAQGRIVTLEQHELEEWVTCHDLGNGDLLWTHRYPSRHYEVLGGLGPRSTPTIVDDRVYTLGATGNLLCLNLMSGDVLWKVDLLKLGQASLAEFETIVKWGRAGSPLVIGSQLIVPFGALQGKHKSLVAFDRMEGTLLWTTGGDAISYASPIVGKYFGEDHIVSVNEKTVSLHRVSNGEERWSYSWPGLSNSSATCTQPIVVAGDRLILTKGYGGGSEALQLAQQADGTVTNELLWKKTNHLRTKFSNPILVDEHVFGICEGTMECVRISDGSREWKGGRFGHGQMLRLGKHLVVSCEDGDLAVVEADAKAFRLVARLPVLDGITWNMPTAAFPYFLMRNGSEMACLKLPMKDAGHVAAEQP